MTILAAYNLKGGVGKTATAVNLAWLAARDGLRTLVWDLDPQGAATFYFRVRPKVKGGAKGIVKGRTDAERAIRGTDWDNLDLLPADFRYRKLDVLIKGRKRPLERLEAALGPVAQDYDLIVLDCAPSLSLTTENVFWMADALVVPLIPTTLSVRTLDQLTAFLARKDAQDVAVWPFFTMVDGRKKLHAEVMAELPARADLLRTVVPHASEVERMGLERAPVGTFAPSSPGAAAYAALWREVSERVRAL